MTIRTQPITRSRWALSFLAALVAVVTIVGLAGTASAATQGTAGTRVRASASVVEVLVGPPEHIAAGQRLGNEPSRVVTTVATGVAVNGGRSVAMGRNMADRVIPYAEKKGYGYYKGTPKWVPRNTIERVSPSALEKTDLWFNKRWINGEMRRGSKIFDIGEPPGYRPSSFYDMERQQVSGYWNYFEEFQP